MIVFMVKITVKVQNSTESLCIMYLLYHWSLGSQTRCADLLLIITKSSTTKWAYIRITPSVCPSVPLSFCPCVGVCLDNISWTAQPFLTKLCIVVCYYKASVLKKNWFTIFHVKISERAYVIKMWLFLLYLLNYWSVCNQTWFVSTTL